MIYENPQLVTTDYRRRQDETRMKDERREELNKMITSARNHPVGAPPISLSPLIDIIEELLKETSRQNELTQCFDSLIAVINQDGGQRASQYNGIHEAGRDAQRMVPCYIDALDNKRMRLRECLVAAALGSSVKLIAKHSDIHYPNDVAELAVRIADATMKAMEP